MNMKKKSKLLLGNNITELKKLPDNSIDSVVTDPPYGLSFMNKKWDHDVPSVEFWREIYRVLKPGGHILSFGGTRTYHRMVVNIEDAGFEIRDQIMWLYGSGFPKSHNIGKAIDKIEGNEREVVGWEGWGTALKPANEPICVARKPLSEKSVAENVLKWGTGGLNIDGCRIEGAYGSGQNEIIEGKQSGVMYHNYDGDTKPATGHKQKIMVSNPEGRFPANIILDETAAELLDKQSGISKTNHKGNRTDKGIVAGVNGFGRVTEVARQDSGGASRFFYVAKVSKKERNMGLNDFDEKDITDGCQRSNADTAQKYGANRKSKNIHPTVKPINLMTYLCRLITPKNGIILDPFMGSGSTGVSALLEDFRFVGIELDSEYMKIAESRIENFEKYRPLIKN